jgi:hypothetical protein
MASPRSTYVVAYNLPRGAPIVLLILLGAVGFTVSCRRPPDPGFAGTWVMRLDEQPFVVLALEPENGHYAGTLSRPLRMTTDGKSVSRIGRDITVERVTTDAPGASTLRLMARAADSSETREFEFSLKTDGTARLKLADAPFEAWPMTRHVGPGTPQVWNGWDEKRSYLVEQPYVAPNAQMAEIYEADQAQRQSLQTFQAQATEIEKDDAVRREQVRALLNEGALQAGEDFRLAAMVFQHGSQPRDFLFAHTLALIALAKGDRSASWIAAASLDRYLLAIGQPQIFGNQFGFDGRLQEPLDRELVSDALRGTLGVPTLAEQQAQMERLLAK